MQIEFVLNDFDAGPWLIEDGLIQSEIVRLGRSVVTLNGTIHQGQIIKRGITANFVEMRDKNWYALNEALSSRPVLVKYVDDRLGPRIAKFLVSNPSAAAKTVQGGITYFDKGTVTLEEV